MGVPFKSAPITLNLDHNRPSPEGFLDGIGTIGIDDRMKYLLVCRSKENLPSSIVD